VVERALKHLPESADLLCLSAAFEDCSAVETRPLKAVEKRGSDVTVAALRRARGRLNSSVLLASLELSYTKSMSLNRLNFQLRVNALT